MTYRRACGRIAAAAAIGEPVRRAALTLLGHQQPERLKLDVFMLPCPERCYCDASLAPPSNQSTNRHAHVVVPKAAARHPAPGVGRREIRRDQARRLCRRRRRVTLAAGYAAHFLTGRRHHAQTDIGVKRRLQGQHRDHPTPAGTGRSAGATRRCGWAAPEHHTTTAKGSKTSRAWATWCSRGRLRVRSTTPTGTWEPTSGSKSWQAVAPVSRLQPTTSTSSHWPQSFASLG